MKREVFWDDDPMRPDLRPWASELVQNWGCIYLTIRHVVGKDDEYTARDFAYMRKEANRMASDIERMAEHAGFSREDLDNEHPL